VQVRRRISRRIRRSAEGINLAADINADVSMNVTESGRPRAQRPSSARAGRKEQGKETR